MPNDNEIDILTPVPDETEEVDNNIPYRGDVDHGVDPDRSDDEFNPGLKRWTPETEADDEDTPPLPVVIVSNALTELARYRVHRTTVEVGKSDRIVGYENTRSQVKVTHCGDSGIIYIGETPMSANRFSGWPLYPHSDNGDSTIVINGSQEVFATYYNADDNTDLMSEVAIVSEYRSFVS